MFQPEGDSPTGLQDSVRDAFAPGSRLSQLVEEFRPRQGQTDMALAIARTVEDGGDRKSVV